MLLQQRVSNSNKLILEENKIRKIKILITAIMILVLAVVISELKDNNISDNYPPEYKQILKRTEYCMQYSDTAVIAEYIAAEDRNYYRFIISECIFGNMLVGEELLINIPEADSVTIRNYEIHYSSTPKEPYTEYIDEYWYIDNLLVDLTPGEKYLILGEELYPYKGHKRLKQFVMHTADFSITDVEGLIIEKSDAYLSLTEYVKYMDKRYGHGNIEW